MRDIFLILVLLALPLCSAAQFRNNNITNNTFQTVTIPGQQRNDQNQNPDETEEEEEVMHTKPAFTIGRYFRSLAHKDTMNITPMFLGSILLPGTSQIYNREYWKLPVIYGGIGAFIGAGVACNISHQHNGKKSTARLRDLMFAGAALTYWGSIMDGVVKFKSVQNPLPARASLYSALLPGLGQAYNGDYWKIPIFYGGLALCGYCWGMNQQQYKRYKNLYIEAASPDSSYEGHLTLENIKWYRDSYRRYRDYSIIATALVYALNIVDANVFAHFNNFDISDDITLNVEPAVIQPVTTAPAAGNYYTQGFGLQMNLKF